MISFVFLLFSCGGGGIAQSGLNISDKKPIFSEQTEAKSKEVFYSILEGAYVSGGMPNVPEAKAKELRLLAEKVWEITTDCCISEAQYSRIIEEILKNKEKFVSLLSGANQGVDALKSVYYSLTSGGGPDYAGHVLYNLLVFGMDYKYTQQMERYDKYGYSYLLEEAQAIQEKRQRLTTQIGQYNFSLAARIAIMASELFFGGAFGGAAESFSNREILIILKRIDIHSFKIDNEGYEFLLSLSVPDVIDGQSSLAERILYTANQNRDLEKIASVMEDFRMLLLSAQENLSDKDAELLRNGELSELVYSVFTGFEDDEWESFEKITGLALGYGEYEALFAETYGEDFENYSAMQINSVALSELRDSTEKEEFLEKLEGYLAGISPVLSYRIFK